MFSKTDTFLENVLVLDTKGTKYMLGTSNVKKKTKTCA